MDNFVFYNPVKIIFGKRTIPQIGMEIKKSGLRKILILAGGGSIKNNGVYDSAVKSLSKENIIFKEFWGVRPNPSLSHALEAIEIIKSEGIEGILAIGGGSVIDEAKAIAAGVFLNNLWDAFEGKENIEKALPIFTILTLSGTCSEMDPYAVLTNDAEQKKWPFKSNLLFPKVSIIDPSVQMSLPWGQTVNGAIDAMSHIMEYHFLATDEEAVISGNESLLKTLIKSLDKLKIDGRNYSARANIAWSALLALNGIAGASLKGGDWAVHRIEHGLSALKPEVAHGAGLAVLFPAWILYMHEHNSCQFNRWAKEVWHSDNPAGAVEAMRAKYKEWGAPVSLGELGFNESDIESIAENVLAGGKIGILKEFDENDICNILRLAL